MKFIGIAIALTLAASLELEVDLLSIFDSLKRADGGLLKKKSFIESDSFAPERHSSDCAYQSRQEGGTLASLLTEAPTPLLLPPSLMRRLRLSLLASDLSLSHLPIACLQLPFYCTCR